MTQKFRFLIAALLLLWIGFHVPVYAQNGKGVLMIAVSPSDAVIRIDTALFKQKTTHMQVDTGTYTIRAWAPGRVMITETIHVKESPPVLFRRDLEYTPEYREYRKQKRGYNIKMTNLRYIPGGATIAAGVYLAARYQVNKSDADRNKQDAEESLKIYSSLTDQEQIEFYRAKYLKSLELHDEAIRKANDTRSLAMIVVPAGIVTTGVCYFLSRKVVKPVFEEVPALSGLSFDYSLSGDHPGPRFHYSYKF